MSIETGVLINFDGQVIYWHFPPGRNAAFLPDSKSLWDVIWEHKDELYAIAHSHPGSGLPSPSETDVTTFSAIERGIGKRLIWPITTKDSIVVCRYNGPGKYDYKVDIKVGNYTFLWNDPVWLEELRKQSNYTIEVEHDREYYPGQ